MVASVLKVHKSASIHDTSAYIAAILTWQRHTRKANK